MREGCIGTISGNGCEAWLDITLLFFTEAFKYKCTVPLIEFVGSKNLQGLLCEITGLIKGMFHKVKILCDSHAILDVSLFHIFNFGRIFAGLPLRSGKHFFNDLHAALKV